VLAAVVPGQGVRLSLNNPQKHELRDHEAKLGLRILRHTEAARQALGAPDEFPFTPEFMQAVARKLGVKVGIKRAYTLRRRLTAAEVIREHGSYRPAYSNTGGDGKHRVTLYKLAVRATRYVRCAVGNARRSVQASVGRTGVVKRLARRRWWEHGLFGMPDGKPPPGLTPDHRRRWKSADERERTWR
jgi:hypothetical protein